MQSDTTVGRHVLVRGERWRIADVRAFDACRVVSLIGIGRSNFAVTRSVIAPFDAITPLARVRPRLRLVGIRRWRRACRRLLASHGPADGLPTARDARIDLLPHQLEPALAIVRGLGSRVLIADEVGLGKTIQAGLIAAELRGRMAADRILVLTPAGLREQWIAELRDRFELEATLFDISGARRRAAVLPAGVNPWSTVPIAVASFDYVKRPEVLPSVAACRWDLVIVDEAHGLAPGSGRRAAIQTLCERAAFVVLLTATPHSGDHAAFESLCAIGRRGGDRLLLFRRSRRDAGLGPERRIHSLFVQPTAAESRMHRRLEQACRALAAASADHQTDAWLAIAVLQKRALSSASSLAQTLERRLSTLGGDDAGRALQLGLPLDDPAGELDRADEPPPWPVWSLDAGIERSLLPPLLDAARAAAGAGSAESAESKMRALARLVRRLLRRSEPVIVFTEFRDTLARVRRAVAAPSSALHGGLTAAERRAELACFRSGERQVLIATDAAGEGLNLHHTCRVVINLELPWNPMRLEQRIGRVDRIGQSRRVHVFHLVGDRTGETRVLDCLRTKIDRARAEIDVADPLGPGDRAIAQAIVNGVAPAVASGIPAEPVPQVRLTAEAARAAAHVSLARTFRGGDWSAASTEDERTPLAAVTRSSETRLRLAGRWLAVVHHRLTDRFGHLVASRLMPLLLVPGRDARPDAAEVTASLAQIVQFAAANDAWTTEAIAFHQAFWRCLRNREEAIAGSSEDGVLLQPGLFDRRELRSAAASGSERAALVEASRWRIAAAQESAAVDASVGLALLLLPGRRW